MILSKFCIGLVVVTACMTGLVGTAATQSPFPVLALSTNDRVLVMAPHPDDESLGCGGIIQAAVERHIPVHVVFFGYRPDRPFHEMPKLRISLGELKYKVTDGLQRLDDNTATVTYRNKSISLRVPLAALGNPDRILISAKTSRAEVPFDWVAWRILVLPLKRASPGVDQ